ncbi:MAG: glycerol kinase GlpK, partial [Bacteroidales bacterium]|nr:glycerol kinase GlpK [Bacteroidales bacterium]
KGDILFGTVDSFILWHLTGGKIHATDVSNASRTMLFNIHTLLWDDELIKLFDIPKSVLPQVMSSSGFFGNTSPDYFGDVSIPVFGIAGDQQSALFGQTCFEKGMTKNTYGTGCFILMNSGHKPVASANGLISTIAWKIGDEVTYALEGSVFVAGSLIKWLRDNIHLINTASQTESMAKEAIGSDSVFFVPAFSGLGAPHWHMNARGLIVGLTFDTTKEAIVKAALESLAFQSKDVISAMEKDCNTNLKLLYVDGGAAVNDYLMQFQADILNSKVLRPRLTESTALGAAMLAGIGIGFWNKNDLIKSRLIDKVFSPQMNTEKSDAIYAGWLNAVEKAKL